MSELDDMADMGAIRALSDWLSVQADGDDTINTARMIEACMFALMHFGQMDEKSLSELAAAAIKQASKRSAYADAVDFLYDLRDAKE